MAEFNIDASLLESMKQVKKVELHLHLGGSFPIDFIKSIASTAEFEEVSKCMDQLNEKVNYHDGFRLFELVGKIVNTNDRIENGAKAVCESLVADGVSYVEIRTGLKDLGSGLEDYLLAVFRGIEKGCAGSDIEANVILILRRNSPKLVVQHTFELLKKFYKKGVVGLDISGDSSLGDGAEIFAICDEIHALGIPVTLHIGEIPDEDPMQQMTELTRLKPKRIGHGVHLCAEALAWVLQNRVPLEMCLSSAVKAQMVDTMEQHPGLALMAQGHPVVVCSDDPLNFSTTLSLECAFLCRILGCSVDKVVDLQQLATLHKFSS